MDPVTKYKRGFFCFVFFSLLLSPRSRKSTKYEKKEQKVNSEEKLRKTKRR